MIRGDAEWRAGLAEAPQLLAELTVYRKDEAAAPDELEASFDTRCKHSGAAMRWAKTTKSGKAMALDRRQAGPYLLSADGNELPPLRWTARCPRKRGHSTPDGCPSSRVEERVEKEELRYREWQANKRTDREVGLTRARSSRRSSRGTRGAARGFASEVPCGSS